MLKVKNNSVVRGTPAESPWRAACQAHRPQLHQRPPGAGPRLLWWQGARPGAAQLCLAPALALLPLLLELLPLFQELQLPLLCLVHTQAPHRTPAAVQKIKLAASPLS